MTLPAHKLTREHRLIEYIKQITAESLIGDDCAVLPGQQLVSSDMLVEGQHFLLPQMSFCDLGWKSMAVNLSDIAAMGGIPEFALVNIGLPSRLSDEEFRLLYLSLNECASRFGTRIIGGDLTGSDALVISITVLGRAHPHGVFLREAARPGDLVIATGDFGASALGLALMLKGELSSPASACAVLRHCRPQPRLAEAQKLADLVCPARIACMDTSDGLADALCQISTASNVSLQISAAQIPVEPQIAGLALKLGLDPLELALYGGEDYELLACIPESAWAGLSPTGMFELIGQVESGKDVILTGLTSGPVVIDQKKTFQHWQANSQPG